MEDLTSNNGNGHANGVKPDMSALHSLREEALNVSLALSSPIEVLAKGGTKTQAAWAGFKDIMTVKVLGPLTAATFLALGLGRALLKVARNAESIGDGLRSLARMESIRTQFEILLGSISRARQRMADLANFAKTSPFEMADVAAANRNLQLLTGGMLAGTAGMKMVGDAATATSNNIEEVAFNVGRFYSSLKEGVPAGRAAQQLMAMGVITASTQRKIEELQASGVQFGVTWALVENDMRRFSGSMAASERTVEGLQKAVEEAHAARAVAKAESLKPEQVAGLEAELAATQALTPVMRELYAVTGVVTNAWSRLKSEIVLAAAKSGLLATVVKGALYTGIIGIIGVLSAAAGRFLMFGVRILGAITPLVAYIRENGIAAAVTMGLARALQATANVFSYLVASLREAGFQMSNLERAQKAVQAASDRAAARANGLATAYRNQAEAAREAAAAGGTGSTGLAGSTARGAEAAETAAVGTAAAAAATKWGRFKAAMGAALSGVMTMGTGALRVLKVLGAEIIGAFLNPVALIASAATAIALYAATLKQAYDESRRATRETNDMTEAFKRQAAAIRTVDDKARYMASSLEALSKAQEDYANAQEEYNNTTFKGPIARSKLANAQERLSAAQLAVARGSNIRDNSLIPNQEELDRLGREADIGEKIKDLQLESRVANAITDKERLDAINEQRRVEQKRQDEALSERENLLKMASEISAKNLEMDKAMAGASGYNPERLRDLEEKKKNSLQVGQFSADEENELANQQRARGNMLRAQQLQKEMAALFANSPSRVQQLRNQAAKASSLDERNQLIMQAADLERHVQEIGQRGERLAQLGENIKPESSQGRAVASEDAAKRQAEIERQAILADAGRQREEAMKLRREEAIAAIDAEQNPIRKNELINQFASQFTDLRPGEIVAHSLQRVAGGGGAAGPDPTLRLQQTIMELNRGIYKNTGDLLFLLREIAQRRGSAGIPGN